MTHQGADLVRVIATGGTIASHQVDGVWSTLPGAQLVGELGSLPVQVDVVDVASGSSSNLSVDDMVRICRHVEHAINEGVHGVVVTHGTDTLELTSFLCSLLVDTSRCAVVFTGAMRPHSAADIDGPRNLRDAIALAASVEARNLGVVVALGGVVHAPCHVHKVNAVDVEAFSSYPFGPFGSMVDGRFVPADAVEAKPNGRGGRMVAPIMAREIDQRVPLVVSYPGMHPEVLERACGGARAVVLEAFGELNSPENLWPVIRRATDDGLLVVVTSCSHTPTAHSESLDLLGARGTGGLTSQKSRLALMCALGDGRSRDEANAYLDALLEVRA